MKTQETLWKKLHPECKQAIKNIKKDYPTTFEDLKNQLKNEINWVNIRYGTASRIMDECDLSFFGNAFRK